MAERHQAWRNALPKDPSDLWDVLAAFDTDSRQALFAHCVSLSVNAVFEAYNRKPRALVHADRLAQAVDLDMVAAGWTPTAAGYLGRVTKARILGAVREAKGERAAQLIDHLKKVEMTEKAETLLEGSLVARTAPHAGSRLAASRRGDRIGRDRARSRHRTYHRRNDG